MLETRRFIYFEAGRKSFSPFKSGGMTSFTLSRGGRGDHIRFRPTIFLFCCPPPPPHLLLFVMNDWSLQVISIIQNFSAKIEEDETSNFTHSKIKKRGGGGTRGFTPPWWVGGHEWSFSHGGAISSFCSQPSRNK